MNTENIIASSIKFAMDFSKIDPVMNTRFLDDREIARILRLAISAEHDAVSLYENIVDSIKNVEIKKLLQSIANEEKVHVGELSQALQLIDKEDEKLVNNGKTEAAELIQN